jgi:uridylate kinase
VPARTFDEALLASRSHAVVVLGGTHAGHTTDAVTVMMGERARARRVVIATNVDGVYSADPKRDPSARRLTRLTAEELVRLTIAGENRAGSPGVIDPLGAKLVARSGIETAVVKGTDLKALEAALLGEEFDGSLVEARRG